MNYVNFNNFQPLNETVYTKEEAKVAILMVETKNVAKANILIANLLESGNSMWSILNLVENKLNMVSALKSAKELLEKNAFLNALTKAKETKAKTFEFNGKEYDVFGADVSEEVVEEKFKFTEDQVNMSYGFYGTLETVYKESQVQKMFTDAVNDLMKAFKISEDVALLVLNAPIGRVTGDMLYSKFATTASEGVLKYFGGSEAKAKNFINQMQKANEAMNPDVELLEANSNYGAPAGLSKVETKKVAETLAKAISKNDGVKCTVNIKTLEEDSFDLDIDGEEYNGGSYNIYNDGSVRNMAIRGEKYGTTTSTVEDFIKGLKKPVKESVNEALSSEQKMVETFLKKVAKEFDYSIQDAVRFVKETISKMGLDEELDEAKKYDLGFGSLGNGTTVYNRAKEVRGDYETVAHISDGGNITYYDKKMPENVKKQIEDMAAYESAANETKVNEGVGTIALGIMLAWVGLKVIGAVAKKVIGTIGANVELPAEKLKQVTNDMVSRAAKETGSGKMLLLGTFLKIDLDEKIDSGEIKTVSALEKAMEEYLSTNESVVNESQENDILASVKAIRDFNRSSKVSGDINQLAVDIIKNLGFKAVGSNVTNTIEHLANSTDRDEKIPEDKTLVRELYSILESKANEGKKTQTLEVVYQGPIKKYRGDLFKAIKEDDGTYTVFLDEPGRQIVNVPASDVRLVESVVAEGAMSDIDIIAQEAKDFKSFVKEFKKEYKNMDAGNPKELEAWLQSVYDAAKENMDESLINEDSSMAFLILMNAAIVNGILIGQMAASGGGGDFTPIEDLKNWWKKRKSDKALKSIIDKIKDDEDVVEFMKLTPAQQRGKFRSLIATKLTGDELEYLNKINRSHFKNESLVTEKDETVFIEFLNKDKNFKKDTKHFKSYDEAVKWAKANFDKFSPDMIKYESLEINEKKEVTISLRHAVQANSIFDDMYTRIGKKEATDVFSFKSGADANDFIESLIMVGIPENEIN